MARKLELPFPPLKIIKSSTPLNWTSLEESIKDRLRDGVSLCVVRKEGVQSRGGYFFHLRQEGGKFIFSTFDYHDVYSTRSTDECIALINHAAGLNYSEKMWQVSQRINIREDRI